MTFVDLGCNDGFFTIPAAKIIGNSGKAYGVDISEEAIAKLQKEAKLQKLTNIQVRVGEAEKIIFATNSADIIFLNIVLHDFHNPTKVLQNAHAMLKPNGKLINIDWQKKQTEMGPPLEKRLSLKEARDLITSEDFHIIEAKDISENYYQIEAEKKIR